MAFLTLNGLTIPTLAGGQIRTEEIGKRVRAHDGTLLVESRAVKRQWRFTTVPQTQAIAVMLRNIIIGRGHFFPLDSDANSSGGVAPSAESDTTYLSNTASDAGANSVKNTYAAGGATANAALETGAVGCYDAATNVLPADERDAENAVVPYGSVGAPTVTSDTTYHWQGSRSVKSVGTSGEGVKTSDSGAFGGGTDVTGSVYVYHAIGGSVKINIVDDQATASSETFALGAGQWSRIWKTHTLDAAATQARIEVTSESVGSLTIYADGFQLEAGDVVTAWVDGSRSAATEIDYGASLMSVLKGASGLTISAWVNGNFISGANATVADLLFGAAGADGIALLHIEGVNGYPQFTLTGASGASVSVTDNAAWAVPYGPWRHLVATIDFGTLAMALYLSGSLEASGTANAAPGLTSLSSSVAYVGHAGSGVASLNGEIDRLQILPCAVNAAWVTAEYGSGTPPSAGLPRITMAGDCIPESSVTVRGKIVNETYRPLTIGGSHASNNISTEFVLEEI